MYLGPMKIFHRGLLFAASKHVSTARLMKIRESIVQYPFGIYQESNVWCNACIVGCPKHFCSSAEEKYLSWEGSSRGVLLKKLESALLDCKDDDVWKVFSSFKSSYGFPPPSVLSKLICGLSYSLDGLALPKACNMVFRIAKENCNLLQLDSLSRLCLSLGRAQMYVHASKILRLMLVKDIAPTMDILSSVFMHMVKTEAGTHLSSNVLLEFCDRYHYLSSKKCQCGFMKPTTSIFNLVLEACVRFGSSLKGEEIIEAMAQIGVVADVHSVLLFTCVYEMNGQRDELKRLKEYIDRVSAPLARYYAQFYNKLLCLHLKFDDVDAAASLIEDIYFNWGSRPLQCNEDLMKPYLVPIGSPYVKDSLRIQVMFELLQKDSIFHVKGEDDLLVFENGNLILNNKGLAQLISGFKRSERISDFSKLLAAIERKLDSKQQFSLCCDVIHACIYNGFLETAHDILDDLEMANICIPSSTYMLLLNAYCREKMPKEAEALVKQIRKASIQLYATDETTISKFLSGELQGSLVELASSRQSELTYFLIEDMKRNDKKLSKVYELNSSINFFCKGKMLEDTRKIYRKMQLLNILPTVQSFAYLIRCYSSLENYREITIVWGDIKRYITCGCPLVNRDLYELLLMSFLRGGYFERVLEVIGLMKKHGMYADRWMYKHEFLRLHKNLYRRLKAADGTTEAQKMRIEHVKAFRKWVRNN